MTELPVLINWSVATWFGSKLIDFLIAGAATFGGVIFAFRLEERRRNQDAQLAYAQVMATLAYDFLRNENVVDEIASTPVAIAMTDGFPDARELATDAVTTVLVDPATVRFLHPTLRGMLLVVRRNIDELKAQVLAAFVSTTADDEEAVTAKVETIIEYAKNVRRQLREVIQPALQPLLVTLPSAAALEQPDLERLRRKLLRLVNKLPTDEI
jgi:hypothetical protein